MIISATLVVGALLAPFDTVRAVVRYQDMPAMQQMWTRPLPGGWTLAGMGQVLPVFTLGRSRARVSPLNREGFNFSQPVGMLDLASPGRRVALRMTPNLEALTQEDGELTIGMWGEGFLDSRHPHALVHELMLSVGFGSPGGRAGSISVGRGFAPYGTEDPMSRPGLKYPTNHHLSQIPERWTLTGTVLVGAWSIEAGVFGGSEPDGPYDLGNVRSFGDSWSARIIRRIGADEMSAPTAELSGSIARLAESHAGGDPQTSTLANVAVRFERAAGAGYLYALLEGSLSDPEEGEGYGAVLGEARWTVGRHQPYLRLERSRRPEFARGAATGDAFFRYDHDSLPTGATSWSVATLGYGHTLTEGGFSVRPFVEGQWFRIADERGVSVEELFGNDRAYGLAIGLRVFFGGDPMRMGSYGVLDPMGSMGAMDHVHPGMVTPP